MTDVEMKAATKARRDIKVYFFLQKIIGLDMAMNIATSNFRFKFELSELFLKIDEKLGKIFLDD
jgi:hypothetical protein